MKHMKQFAIIMTVTYVGEILGAILPFTIPASVYGLCIMLILLISGVLKVEQVKETGGFMVQTMQLMFIPITVGLIASWSVLSEVILPVTVIIAASTFTVIAVSGGTAKAMEIGQVEGAMSSLAIVIAGLCTIVFIPLFVNFI